MNEDEAKERFKIELEDFDKTITPLIMDTMNEKEYMIETQLYGMTSIVRRLIAGCGQEEFREIMVDYLQYK